MSERAKQLKAAALVAALLSRPGAILAVGIALGVVAGASLESGGGGPGSVRASIPPAQFMSTSRSPSPDAGAGNPAIAPPEAEPRWRRYAVAMPDPGARPLIAVVIDDIGVDKARSLRAIDLQGPLTMAVLPYASGLPVQIAAARANGHEIIVHIPMEPHDGDADPGPNFMAMAHDGAAFRTALDWNLGRVSDYVGFSNHMGSRYTEDAPRMRRLLAAARSRGLLFLDSMTSGDSVGIRIAEELGVPHARRDVFLDNERSAPEIWQRLAQLEATARRRGFAVGIGHPHDATIEVLATWLADARRRGFELAPISAVIHRRLALGGQRLVHR